MGERGDPSYIRDLFLQLLDRPSDAKKELLERLPPEVRREVETLLASERGSETIIQGIVNGGRIHVTGPGEQFGPFRTSELLGRGGMGAVYKAERTDGEVSQTVAIKVIERGWLNPHSLDRFRDERQFLAGLTHPNIARLIDGGTRDDGVPYLAMEYVEGVRIDQYCKQHHLTVEERLRLFLPVCNAVEAAHQRLIVHRDLKPSNILVTAEGQPKLLDFGIAKALDDPAETQTIVLTPDFASPEQLRGEQVTTATDIYGLGAVLYFLLTGRATGKNEGESAGNLKRLQLERDLQNILLKALHADPQRRYYSARELGDDIERYLAYRPVRATPDSLAYRTARFVRRHRIACAAGVVALLAVTAGTAATLYQAHRARERFAQVRALSNRFIFDFESSIASTPGTLAAQKMVVSTARQYLADLAQDAGNDFGLNRELAESYYRLGVVERNLGDIPSAIGHLKTSISLLKKQRDDCCGPAPQRKLYLQATVMLATVQLDSRAVQESLGTISEAVPQARRWAEDPPHEGRAVDALVGVLNAQAVALRGTGRLQEARDALTEAAARSGARLSADPHNSSVIEDRARAGRELADVLNELGDYSGALEAILSTQRILDEAMNSAPENVSWRSSRIRLASNRSAILIHLAENDPKLQPQILDAAEEAYHMAHANSAANPGSQQALDLEVTMAGRLAARYLDAHQNEKSIALQREILATIDHMLKMDPSDRRNLYLRANTGLLLGYNLTQLSRWKDARTVLGEAEQFAKRALSQAPDDVSLLKTNNGILMLQTMAERNLGNLADARERCNAAFRSAVDLMQRNKQAKEPVPMIEILRSEARRLKVRDITLPGASR